MSFGLENDSGNIVEPILVQIFSAIFGMVALFGNSLVSFVIGKFPAIRNEINLSKTKYKAFDRFYHSAAFWRE